MQASLFGMTVVDTVTQQAGKSPSCSAAAVAVSRLYTLRALESKVLQDPKSCQEIFLVHGDRISGPGHQGSHSFTCSSSSSDSSRLG